jgi:hypothetical protein
MLALVTTNAAVALAAEMSAATSPAAMTTFTCFPSLVGRSSDRRCTSGA